MSTEQPLTPVENTDDNPPTTENSTPRDDSTSQMTAPAGDASQETSRDAAPRESEEESRPSGEDFGQLLDQFEQEQSTLQEGEVVRGTVIGISERGVVIDFGYKSEGIVNQNEFMENGQ